MRKRRTIAALLALILALCLPVSARAAETTTAAAAEKAEAYLLQAVKDPAPGSVGGEWTVIALSRGGAEGEYARSYYQALEELAVATQGVLHRRKYTEYSRTVLALTAIGKDPANVSGYSLLQPLGDYTQVCWQGINGPIWALIALDAGNYGVPRAPEGAVQASRQMYVDTILDRQLEDGGWSLSGSGSADADVTAMALQALSAYREQERVREAVGQALECLSALQDDDGGYSSYGIPNAESTAQVVIALCALDLSPEDPRFVKGGSTVTEALVRHQLPDGSFRHTAEDSGGSLMTTEQALCALVAAQRAAAGEPGLYRMSEPAAQPSVDLPPVNLRSILAPLRLFPGFAWLKYLP